MGFMHLVTRSLILVVLLLITTSCNLSTPEYKSVDISQAGWETDFELIDHNSRPITLSRFDDQVVAVFFGYTHCPHICSPKLTELAKITRSLGPLAKDFQVLFITVDPVYDTPRQLSGFLPKFHPSFIGVTGSKDKINKTIKKFKIYAEKLPDEGDKKIISHTGGIFIFDRGGKLKLYMKEGMPFDDMVHDIRLLL